MEAIRNYLFQITGAALLCGLLKNLVEEKTTAGATVRMLCGVFMSLVLLSPLWKRTSLGNFDFRAPRIQAQTAAAQGEERAREELERIIMEKTRAYILDKAGTIGAELAVEVRLDSSEIPTPVGVTLRGNVAPYGKKKMQEWIQKDLGIPKEAQIWTV